MQVEILTTLTDEDICRGDTNHAEVILIDFDETQISYAQLLDVFLPLMIQQHSTVKAMMSAPVSFSHFYFNDAQRADAEQTINDLKAEGLNIVTELSLYRRSIRLKTITKTFTLVTHLKAIATLPFHQN